LRTRRGWRCARSPPALAADCGTPAEQQQASEVAYTASVGRPDEAQRVFGGLAARLREGSGVHGVGPAQDRAPQRTVARVGRQLGEPIE